MKQLLLSPYFDQDPDEHPDYINKCKLLIGFGPGGVIVIKSQWGMNELGHGYSELISNTGTVLAEVLETPEEIYKLLNS